MKIEQYLGNISLGLVLVTAPALQVHAESPLSSSLYFDNGDLMTHDQMSEFGSALLQDQKRVQTSQYTDALSLIYVNANSVQDDSDISQNLLALESGAVLVLDNTQLSSLEMAEKVSKRVLGVGFAAPVVITYLDKQKMKYIPISPTSLPSESFVEPIAGSGTVAQMPELNDKEKLEFLLHVTRDTLAEHKYSRTLAANSTFEQQNVHAVGVVPYRPELTFTVEHKVPNMRCWLRKALSGLKFGTEEWDACANNMSVGLVYTVDFIRSLAGSTPKGNTEDAKYVRVSLDKSNGAGSGIHIIDNLIQKHTWFQSWAHRDTWFGPFADSYSFAISHTPGSGVTLLKHLPLAVNTSGTYSETSGITVGVGVNGSVGQEGPKIEGGVNFGYNSSRTVSFRFNEYTVKNNTSNLTARWKWDREFYNKRCDWLTRRDLGACHFTRGWADQSWVTKKSAFSSISYANFVPGLSVTYKAPSSKSDTSRINMKTTIKVMGLGGKVIPLIMSMSKYAIKDWTSTTSTVETGFTVDWQHPAFSPEAHVRIQSMDANNACLDVSWDSSVEGARVVWFACHNRRNQLWGLDSQERYKSRVHPNRCLSVENDLLVSSRACTAGLNQKWYWQGDKLLSRHVDGSGDVYALSQDINNTVRLVIANQGGNLRWKPYLQNITR